LTQEIEDSFSVKKEAEAVFVDITAAYFGINGKPTLTPMENLL